MLDVLQPDEINFEHYMRETDPAAKVRPASEYLDAIMFALAPVHEDRSRESLPFANSWLNFTPGEVTIWAGFNGSGKSMLQGQVLAEIAMRGAKTCIASFEMKPARTLARIARQVTRTSMPSKASVDAFLRETGGAIWVYDQQGTVRSEMMLAVVKHCAEQLKVKHIAIDSLMKCVRGEDDYNGQKEFVDALTACARDYDVHIHLVHHLRKGETDERLPTRTDLRGSVAISDLADNVLLVWRNKKKERDHQAGKQVAETDPDAVLICDKNRNGDWEGRVKLWFDRATLRFRDSVHEGLVR